MSTVKKSNKTKLPSVPELIEMINSECSGSEAYYSECEDVIDFSSFELRSNWSEGLDLDEELIERIDSLRLGTEALKQLLVDASEPRFVDNYYLLNHELTAMPLGEIEVQLDGPDGQLSTYINQLTPEAWVEVRRRVGYHIPELRTGGSIFAYLNLDSCRWALIINPEVLAETVSGIKAVVGPLCPVVSIKGRKLKRTEAMKRAEARAKLFNNYGQVIPFWTTVARLKFRNRKGIVVASRQDKLGTISKLMSELKDMGDK